jgi:hypothetical protein
MPIYTAQPIDRAIYLVEELGLNPMLFKNKRTNTLNYGDDEALFIAHQAM